MNMYVSLVSGYKKKEWQTFSTYCLALNEEEAHGIFHKKYKEELTEINVQVLLVDPHVVAQAILQDKSEHNNENNLYTDNVKLLESFAKNTEYPWFVRGSTVVKMASDSVKYFSKSVENSKQNYNYAAKLKTELDGVKKSLTEMDACYQARVKERVAAAEEELKTVKASINDVLEENKKLQQQRKELLEALNKADENFKELEAANKCLNQTIDNYDTTIQKREAELEQYKKDTESIRICNQNYKLRLERLSDISDQIREIAGE